MVHGNSDGFIAGGKSIPGEADAFAAKHEATIPRKVRFLDRFLMDVRIGRDNTNTALLEFAQK